MRRRWDEFAAQAVAVTTSTALTVFRRHGHEMIAFYAGGDALAASPHGDNL
jgi:hypothetical protein